MAKPQPPRFIPPRLGKRDHARVSVTPRWLTREAVEAFNLTPYDVTALYVIVDNLDSHGVSTTAMTLIATRGGMSVGGAAKAVNRLISTHLLYELDPRSKGRIMRYIIPNEMPWPGAWQ